jgi:hypothetical protein
MIPQNFRGTYRVAAKVAFPYIDLSTAQEHIAILRLVPCHTFGGYGNAKVDLTLTE